MDETRGWLAPTLAILSGMFGSHLSIAGSMHLALIEAERLGLDCVQVFTKNQQQWKAPPLKREAIAAWNAERARLGWQAGVALGAPERVTSHASYLINTASPDDALRAKSIHLLRDEVERCEALGIGLLVFHPGAHTGGTREEGIERIAQACATIIADTSGYATVMCFENVAGAGTTIGRTLEELAALRARAIDLGAPPERLGFCIDTCHAHAAGYDLATPERAAEFMAALDSIVGLSSVRCLHVNDSKGACGSRLDRHEHIGRGTIGANLGGGFGAVVGHPAMAGVPKIMETPKGDDPSGVNWDTINAAALRALASGEPLPVAPHATAMSNGSPPVGPGSDPAPRAKPKRGGKPKAVGKAPTTARASTGAARRPTRRRAAITGGGGSTPAPRAPAARRPRAKAKRPR